MHTASRRNPTRSTRRLLIFLLLVALTTTTVGSPNTYGQDDALLTAPFGPALFLIRAEGETPPALLPPTTVVHARLDAPSGGHWVASGSPEDVALLVSAGLDVQIVDENTAGAIYYVADAAAPRAAELAADVGRLLWRSEMYLIVATDADHELTLLETLPPQGVSVSLLTAAPLYVDEAPPTVSTAQATAIDPAVAALLAQITPAELQTLVSQLSGHMPAPVGGGAVTIHTRYTFAGRLRDAEQFVYEYYQHLGLNVRYAPWSYGQYSGRNVVAEVRGSTQPERVLLIGGHLDSMSNAPYTGAPGADDNATGTAATLVIARLLAAYQPALTVRFIHFTGEEQGQWGSKVYAGALRRAGEQVLGFINLDMIGWDGNGDRVVEIHTGRGPKSNALADQFLERNERYGVGLSFERKTTTASRFSDHSPFWDNDYASFLVIENFFDDGRPRDRNPNYHTTGDVATQVDYDYTARIARAALATVAELAGYALEGSPGTPTATATSSPTFTPTARPDACASILLNGDFEGSGGWQFGSTPFPARYTTTHVYSGARAAQLGIPTGFANRRAYSTVFQRITIPADAETPVLLRYMERTYGAADNADYREALLLNSNYNFVARLTRSFAAGDEAWRERVFDLSAYRGRTLVVYFNVYNDGVSSQMWSFLDRIELGSCVRISSPETPTPEPTTTPGPDATPTPTAEPTQESRFILSLTPDRLYLGSLFESAAVTGTVQLGEQRTGFAWSASTDVAWLQLTRISAEEQELLVAAPVETPLEDGVYTATIRIEAAALPDVVLEAPVLYVRGEVQRLYLPTIAMRSAEP
ncbi:MAG: M20/M25/M40 family metallo-hydrolase [Caldilinea sp.]|nr:M20/M25/M40 family metallo-hydrolase [Caldilinea sp.]MDW8439090.1 M20/M25/M40 family metallo-hydrolase [Caldilineaceae bacterium]